MDAKTYWTEFEKERKFVGWFLRFKLNRWDWEDLTQDVAIKGFNACESYVTGSFRAWLGVIARTMTWDLMRRERRYTVYIDQTEFTERRNPNQEQRVQAKEVVRWMSELPSEQRDILQLHLCGYTPDEVAERLKIPKGTSRSRGWRAKTNLIAMIEDASIGLDREPIKAKDLVA